MGKALVIKGADFSEVAVSQVTLSKLFNIVTKVSPANAGVVSGGGSYPLNSSVVLTASERNHYNFLKWSDNNISNPRTVTVTEDKVYTALFSDPVFTPVDMSSYTPQVGFIDGGNPQWIATPAQEVVCIFVEIKQGDLVKLKTNSAKATSYAIFKSIPTTNGQTSMYAEGENNRHVVLADTEVEFAIESADAAYLYIFLGNPDTKLNQPEYLGLCAD